MGGLLSHSEIESLLSGIEPVPTRTAVEPSVEAESPKKASSWESHDFREPDPLPRKAIEFLQALHAGLCHRLGRRFTSLLHANVDFRPVGLTQMRLDECVSESPSLFCQIGSPTQAACWLISWQPSLAHSLFNRLLGGAMLRPSDPRADVPSEIEVRLLDRLCRAVLHELGQLAEPNQLGDSQEIIVVSVQPQIRPEFAGDPYFCVSFEIACEGDRGLMHCWLPKAHLAFGPLKGQENRSRPSSSGPLTAPTQQAKIELSADLASLRFSVSEVAELAIGDVLMTGISQQEGVTLRLADRALYRVTIGTLFGKMAVRITKPLLRSEVSVSIDETPTRP
jgi:flagellar motor switch protein FliM